MNLVEVLQLNYNYRGRKKKPPNLQRNLYLSNDLELLSKYYGIFGLILGHGDDGLPLSLLIKAFQTRNCNNVAAMTTKP